MTQDSFSLSELNRRVKNAICDHLPETYWLRAETSDVRRNQNGHCYLEFVEKDAEKQHIVAKARGMIWSNVFQMLSAYFEAETGQSFTSGAQCAGACVGRLSRALRILPYRGRYRTILHAG